MKTKLSALLVSLGLLAGATGCDSLLEVSNPNNIAGDDILDPVAAAGLANGAQAGVARGFANALTSFATVTDELEWSGSRDAYQELDFGPGMTNPFNEFLDSEYPQMARGSWMAREAVRVLELHQADGNLNEVIKLAEAYVWRAISYLVIGEMYQDWTFSDRATAAAPVGPANMQTATFDPAIADLGQAISIAQAEGDSELEQIATALRARAQFNREIWSAARNASGLVSSAAAEADALSAIGQAGGVTADWRFDFNYAASTVGNNIAAWVNDRQEMRFAAPYASPDPGGAPTYDAVALEDLIDAGTVSPELDRIITTFTAGDNYPSLTVTGTREMHLIAAEHQLATGSAAGFETHINHVRAMDGALTLYDRTTHDIDGNGTPDEMSDYMMLLSHMRATNLFLTGRRLGDMYRFGETSPQWQASPHPNFLPITVIECRANENIPDNC